MKASRFTDAQKAYILNQGEDGMTVAKVCRKDGISQATYFTWKKKYAGLMPSEMRRVTPTINKTGTCRIVAMARR
jgi:putative transposase